MVFKYCLHPILKLIKSDHTAYRRYECQDCDKDIVLYQSIDQMWDEENRRHAPAL